MNQYYQTPREGDNQQTNQIVVDQKLLELKESISPGRSRVYVDRDFDMRLRITHLDNGDLGVTLEYVPDISNVLSRARTLNDYRKAEVSVFGPHVTAQDDLVWRKGAAI